MVRLLFRIWRGLVSLYSLRGGKYANAVGEKSVMGTGGLWGWRGPGGLTRGFWRVFTKVIFQGCWRGISRLNPRMWAMTEEEEPRAKALLGGLVQGAEAPC